MEYNNVGASHTGHRGVFTTSDEIHLTAHLTSTPEMDRLQGRTGSRRRVRTSLPQAGDKGLADTFCNRCRRQAFLQGLSPSEVERLDKKFRWQVQESIKGVPISTLPLTYPPCAKVNVLKLIT